MDPRVREVRESPDVVRVEVGDHDVRDVLRPALDLRETALHQIRQLGFRAEDVTHIVVTHFDADHVGGLADFPDS
ncbi:MBL fold metallo-hydrolase, partial [Streptomyces aurantiacus]|uniref:MBL fold metallo-hydrolase n=1 Tax=Streptomyces aurantiacus TaxID=47760 RepID=UPI0012FEA4EB